ncbi:hypothetical protein IQ07DRAFT_276316 [Pyrenochaeta sp. DS3sAY3a]|nr:hypothetical protein IQ07DRAFT_276316 [Pyrenochaeta sp. DS3sAY3a]
MQSFSTTRCPVTSCRYMLPFVPPTQAFQCVCICVCTSVQVLLCDPESCDFLPVNLPRNKKEILLYAQESDDFLPVCSALFQLCVWVCRAALLRCVRCDKRTMPCDVCMSEEDLWCVCDVRA